MKPYNDKLGEDTMDLQRNTWGYSICGDLIFGKHAIEKLGRTVKKLGGEKVLILTDQTIHKEGHLEKALTSLDGTGVKYEVFDRGKPEPSIEDVLKCAEFARKADFHILVSLGGGSIIDLGKAVAVLTGHGGHPQDYFGEGKVPGPVAPLIAVPTTAGTGSEISPSSILTDVQNNLKKGIADNKLRPTVAIVDPLLTITCPPHVTAATGIDVLAHAIESYMAIDYAYLPLKAGEEDTVLYHGSNPLTDCLAQRGIEMVAENLRIAVDQGQNIEARVNMAMANVITSLAFTNSGVTAVHAMAYPLGAVSHAPHGVVNGLLLPHVMEYNIPVRSKRLAKIAQLMGVNSQGMSEREAAKRAVNAVSELIEDVALPKRMRDIGVKEEDIRPMAEATMDITRLLRGNPRRVTADNLEEIFKRAY